VWRGSSLPLGGAADASRYLRRTGKNALPGFGAALRPSASLLPRHRGYSDVVGAEQYQLRSVSSFCATERIIRHRPVWRGSSLPLGGAAVASRYLRRTGKDALAGFGAAVRPSGSKLPRHRGVFRCSRGGAIPAPKCERLLRTRTNNSTSPCVAREQARARRRSQRQPVSASNREGCIARIWGRLAAQREQAPSPQGGVIPM